MLVVFYVKFVRRRFLSPAEEAQPRLIFFFIWSAVVVFYAWFFFFYFPSHDFLVLPLGFTKRAVFSCVSDSGFYVDLSITMRVRSDDFNEFFSTRRPSIGSSSKCWKRSNRITRVCSKAAENSFPYGAPRISEHSISELIDHAISTGSSDGKIVLIEMRFFDAHARLISGGS